MSDRVHQPGKAWHRLLLPAVERHPEPLWRATHVVAHVLCDLAQAGRGKVSYAGVGAISRRSAAYNGGSELNRRTVRRCLMQLRGAGLVHLDMPGGRGRLPTGRPRGGRGNANGYSLALELNAPNVSYPQVIHRTGKGGLQTPLYDSETHDQKRGPQTPPVNGYIYPLPLKKGTRAPESRTQNQLRPDESLTSPATDSRLGPEPVRHLFGRLFRRRQDAEQSPD